MVLASVAYKHNSSILLVVATLDRQQHVSALPTLVSALPTSNVQRYTCIQERTVLN